MIESVSGVFETQTFQVCPTEQIIGIKRKPHKVSQIPNGTSLNSDIHRLRPNFEIGSLVGRNSNVKN